MAKENKDVSGGDRGLILFAVVLAINIWMFSIPPSFRRQQLCPAEYLEQYPQAECITAETWRGQIVDYYRNGGGVQFDFSVDPATVAKNKAMLDNMFGGKQ